MPGTGDVVTRWWRMGTTTGSYPTILATVPVHGPAVTTTCSASTKPWSVSTPTTRPSRTESPVAAMPVLIFAPRSPAAAQKARALPGVEVAVFGDEVPALDASNL